MLAFDASEFSLGSADAHSAIALNSSAMLVGSIRPISRKMASEVLEIYLTSHEGWRIPLQVGLEQDSYETITAANILMTS